MRLFAHLPIVCMLLLGLSINFSPASMADDEKGPPKVEQKELIVEGDFFKDLGLEGCDSSCRKYEYRADPSKLDKLIVNNIYYESSQTINGQPVYKPWKKGGDAYNKMLPELKAELLKVAKSEVTPDTTATGCKSNHCVCVFKEGAGYTKWLPAGKRRISVTYKPPRYGSEIKADGHIYMQLRVKTGGACLPRAVK